MKYDSYFTSRGVSPDSYDYESVRIPNYMLKNINLNRDSAILEIGCGYGQNMAAFQNSGFCNIRGIDISEQAVSYCKSKGFCVEKKDITKDCPWNGEKYDFVFMLHVLEHIPKEKVIPVLKSIRENYLKQSGSLLIAVPNAQSNTGCYWMYEDFTHDTLYTAGSLLYVLREAGFGKAEIIDMDGLDRFSDKTIRKKIYRILLKMYKKKKLFWNKVTGSTFHEPSPIVYTWEVKAIGRI